MVVVFNATFNNISVISWRPVLLAVKTGVSTVENHWHAVIGTDCIDGYKSNYLIIKIATAPSSHTSPHLILIIFENEKKQLPCFF